MPADEAKALAARLLEDEIDPEELIDAAARSELTAAFPKRESQYVDDYLRNNMERGGDGHGLTIGSYLTYRLRGTAKYYAGKYAIALLKAIERRIAQGVADEGTSKGGGTAYYYTDEYWAYLTSSA